MMFFVWYCKCMVLLVVLVMFLLCELLQGFQMSCPFLPKRWFTSVSVEKWGSYVQKLAKVMPNFPADNCTNRFLPLVYRKYKHVGQWQRGRHF
jgi:hypothetical protein